MRVIFATALLPGLIKALHGKAIARSRFEKSQKTMRTRNRGDLILTLMIGLICGGIGKYLGVPCGAIAFSMAGCAAFNVVTDRSYMPLNLRRFVQMFAGALIGCTVGRAQITQMLDLGMVTLIAVVSFLLLDLVSAHIISRLFHLDIVTALFACAPGGITDMAPISEDMGADSVKVAGMHIVRLVGIVALYPVIIHTLITLTV